MNKLRKIKTTISSILVMMIALSVLVSLTGCNTRDEETDYADMNNWAYYESDSEKKADVFFVCPTVYSGDGNSFNMSINDETTKENFLGAINMEKGIYDEYARFFAPYYRQLGLNAYQISEKERIQYIEVAYSDIEVAFEYYLQNENSGNPIILAGFSQGAELCIRLMKERFKDENLNELLVACYAIGWRITEKDIQDNPHLKFAEGENDTGVIVAFNCEDECIDDSLVIPYGIKSLCINPLNWKTDSTYADKSLNKGACFTNYDGNIESEVPSLTGAYIDPVRGALKVIDVLPGDYPPGLEIFKSGVYHLYDYQFFYRNLQENVYTRLEAFEAV